jgi:hypothetical protein
MLNNRQAEEQGIYAQVRNGESLGGVMVTCLPLHPRFTGSNPAEAMEFLSAIKVRSTPCIGGEVKPRGPMSLRFYGMEMSFER